jgi:F0F1-type ATP synthase assembly protein I
MADPSERERERRHAELIEKHVYGDRERRKIDGKATWFRWASASSVGLEIAVAITMCTLAAHWLENNYTHWAPWTTLIGLAIGLGAAVKAVLRAIRQYERELEAQERAEKEQAEP